MFLPERNKFFFPSVSLAFGSHVVKDKLFLSDLLHSAAWEQPLNDEDVITLPRSQVWDVCVRIICIRHRKCHSDVHRNYHSFQGCVVEGTLRHQTDQPKNRLRRHRDRSRSGGDIGTGADAIKKHGAMPGGGGAQRSPETRRSWQNGWTGGLLGFRDALNSELWVLCRDPGVFS